MCVMPIRLLCTLREVNAHKLIWKREGGREEIRKRACDEDGKVEGGLRNII